jgi:hypothetical protein
MSDGGTKHEHRPAVASSSSVEPKLQLHDPTLSSPPSSALAKGIHPGTLNIDAAMAAMGHFADGPIVMPSLTPGNPAFQPDSKLVPKFPPKRNPLDGRNDAEQPPEYEPPAKREKELREPPERESPGLKIGPYSTPPIPFDETTGKIELPKLKIP